MNSSIKKDSCSESHKYCIKIREVISEVRISNSQLQINTLCHIRPAVHHSRDETQR